MRYEDVVAAVTAARTRDWLHDDYYGTHVLKEDVRIWLREERDRHSTEFREDYVERLIRPEATKDAHVTLLFGAAPLKTFRILEVEGGRAHVPIPDAYGNVVDPLDLAVCRALDLLGMLDETMDRLKFEVKQ
ncbi:MAG TPA: hypothetical protein VFH78_08035 [Candidatus Thermoplasmatota archaeon]|nr:hypothetical protein [Candidatus Thermoplasmatota archaeon]